MMQRFSTNRRVSAEASNSAAFSMGGVEGNGASSNGGEGRSGSGNTGVKYTPCARSEPQQTQLTDDEELEQISVIGVGETTGVNRVGGRAMGNSNSKPDGSRSAVIELEITSNGPQHIPLMSARSNSIGDRWRNSIRPRVTSNDTSESGARKFSSLFSFSGASGGTNKRHSSSRDSLFESIMQQRPRHRQPSAAPSVFSKTPSREDMAYINKGHTIDSLTPRHVRRQRRKEIARTFGKHRGDFYPRAGRESSTSGSSEKDGCKWTFVFDPAGRFAYWWSFVVSIAFVYNFWVIIYRFAFDEIKYGHNMAVWFVLDYTADFLYVLDIAFHFRTGYLDDGVLQTDVTKLRIHYMNSTVFYVDCLCLLPLDFLYLSIGFKSVFRCFRLVKIYRFWTFLDRTERHTNFPNVVRTVTLLHYLFAIFHWNACLIYMVNKATTSEKDLLTDKANMDEKIKSTTTANILEITTPTMDYISRTTSENSIDKSSAWAFPANINDIFVVYLHSLYLSTLILTTIGELPVPKSKPEYVFVIVEFVFGLLLFATILGHVANIVTSISAARKEFQAKLDSVKTYMMLRRVPLRLQDRVIKWFDYLWLSKKSADEDKTLCLLPNKLKAEIALHVHLDTLKRVEIFQNTEAGFLCELVLRLRPVLFSPGDYICRKGEVGKEMYIVNRGRLQVVADNGRTVLATLRPGSYFGEISILNMGNAGNRRTASVRSVGYSDLFCLSKSDLWEVLKDYPTARVRLEAIAVKRLEKYKKAPLEQEASKGIPRSQSTPGQLESAGKIPLEAMLLNFNPLAQPSRLQGASARGSPRGARQGAETLDGPESRLDTVESVSSRETSDNESTPGATRGGSSRRTSGNVRSPTAGTLALSYTTEPAASSSPPQHGRNSRADSSGPSLPYSSPRPSITIEAPARPGPSPLMPIERYHNQIDGSSNVLVTPIPVYNTLGDSIHHHRDPSPGFRSCAREVGGMRRSLTPQPPSFDNSGQVSTMQPEHLLQLQLHHLQQQQQQIQQLLTPNIGYMTKDPGSSLGIGPGPQGQPHIQRPMSAVPGYHHHHHHHQESQVNFDPLRSPRRSVDDHFLYSPQPYPIYTPGSSIIPTITTTMPRSPAQSRHSEFLSQSPQFSSLSIPASGLSLSSSSTSFHHPSPYPASPGYPASPAYPASPDSLIQEISALRGCLQNLESENAALSMRLRGTPRLSLPGSSPGSNRQGSTRVETLAPGNDSIERLDRSDTGSDKELII